VCAENCSLRMELPEEAIKPQSCVYVAGASEGEEWADLVLKRASDAGGEYRVGLTQNIVARPAVIFLVLPTCQRS
jgi:hypothetical protein